MERRNETRRAHAASLDHAEPLPLVRAPLRESWFDEARSAVSSSSEIDLFDAQAVRATHGNSTLLSGAFVGLVSGAAMVLIATLASHVDVARAIGDAVTRGTNGGESAIGIGVVLLVGMIVGGLFARATVHVERMLPIAIFGVVFNPIAVLALHALLARFAPHLANALPFGALVIGAAIAGSILSLVVPLRGRAAAVRVDRLSIA